MTTYQVTVKVKGKVDHTVVVAAVTESKAQAKAMMLYPHKLRGELVEYIVVGA